jgi:hypothetical protein
LPWLLFGVRKRLSHRGYPWEGNLNVNEAVARTSSPRKEVTLTAENAEHAEKAGLSE